jgi:hypothetical protein
MNYKVVVHESEEGFSVSCPGLPGCWSQGETEARRSKISSPPLANTLRLSMTSFEVRMFAK